MGDCCRCQILLLLHNKSISPVDGNPTGTADPATDNEWYYKEKLLWNLNTIAEKIMTINGTRNGFGFYENLTDDKFTHVKHKL